MGGDARRSSVKDHGRAGSGWGWWLHVKKKGKRIPLKTTLKQEVLTRGRNEHSYDPDTFEFVLRSGGLNLKREIPLVYSVSYNR